MPSLNVSVRPALIPGLLAALACVLAAGDARAVPIPTQITYSTSGPEPLKTSAGDVVFEFQSVTDGVATPGADLKLGTILIHRQEAGSGFMFPGVMFPIGFHVSKVGDVAISTGEGEVEIENSLFGTVRPDGRIDGRIFPLLVDDQKGPFQVGGISLTLKPVQTAPLWNLDDESVVAVDVYARLEGAPVPEPSVLLIFAAEAGLGWKRLGNRDARRS